MEFEEKKEKRHSIAIVLGLILGFSVFLFIVNTVRAAELDIVYVSQIGDDYQVLINFDLNEFPDPGIQWNAAAEDDQVFLALNNNLPDYNFSFTSNQNILLSLQPNTFYEYYFSDTGDTVSFTTDSEGLPSFLPQPPQPEPPYFGEAGIFGTSSLVLAATAIRGVQNTTQPLWPLFAFVGVPLAFVIGLLVVQFIKQSVGENRRLAAFDNAKADNLKEFYSRDGGIDPELKKSVLKLKNGTDKTIL